MAFILKDRVKENSTTTGTGNISLGGASATFDTFQSYLTNGDTTFYAIAHTSSGVDEWEVGLGTWNTGNTLSRTTVLAGSNGTSAVDLSAGTKDIFMTYPASKAAVVGEDVTFADITVTGTVDGRDVAADGSKLDGIDTSADVTDAVTVAAAGALMRSGGTMTGNLILNTDPNAALGAATKQYVDTIASAGIHYHAPVRAEHPSNLNATYNNGSSGVGATLTNAGTNAALVIDSVSMVLNDRVLVANQTNQTQNGVYTVTTVGDGSTAWVLTRSTDTDTAAPSDPDAFGKGDAFFIKEGSTNAGHLDVLSTAGTIVFGTTNIVFSEVAETTVYSGGTGITLTGTTFSIGQDVATSANVTFNQVTAAIIGNVTGNLTGDVTGNADTATALETARTIQLSGDVTGSASFDGSANINITAAVQDDSHAHVISNVDGLQSALDAKVPTSRTITAGNGLTGGGDLSANRTLNVGAGSGITVSANDVAHADTSTQASINNSGRTYIQDITLDGFGHVTGLTSATETVTDTTYSAGSGLSLSGTTFSHTDTSSQASVNNSNGTVIQDITLDTYGHITGINSFNLDGRYYTETEADSRFVNVTGDTMSGNLDFNNNQILNLNHLGLDGIIYHVGDTNTYHEFPTTDAWRVAVGGSERLKVQAGTGGGGSPHVIVTGDLKATSNMYIGGDRVFSEAYHPNADTLTTARTINGVSFNGSANITVADSTKLPLAGGTMTGKLTLTAGDDDGASPNPALEITNGTVYISHDEATIIFDEGQKMITTNDGNGNFSIIGGADDDGVHVDSVSGTSGLARMTLDSDGTDGVIYHAVGPRRSGGSAANLTHALRIANNTTTGLTWITGSATYPGSLTSTSSTIFHDNYHPNADRWTTPRTLSLQGDATGQVVWDGSGNAALTVAVINDSHSHSNYLRSDVEDSGVGINLNGGTLNQGNDATFYVTATNNADWGIKIGATSGKTDYGQIIEMPATYNYAFRVLGNGAEHVTMSSDYLYHYSDMRSPIFYDSDDTTYYVNPNGTSSMYQINVWNDVEFKNKGQAITGTYDSYALQGVFNMGDAYKLASNGSTAGNLYGIAWSHPNAGTKGGANNLASHGMLILENGTFKGAWGGGSLRTPNDIRAPIFYDYNNTGYYVDPASTTYINEIHTGAPDGNTTAPRFDTSFYVMQSQHWYGHTSTQGMYLGESGNDVYVRGQMAIGGTAIDASYALTMTGDIDMNNGAVNYVTQLHFNDGVRFVDEGNDNYLRFRWNDTGSGGIKFYDGGDFLHGYVYGDGNGNFGLLDKDEHWFIFTNGTDETQIRANNNVELYIYTDHVYAPGSFRAPVFYDSNNTAYYTDPATYSKLNALQLGSSTTHVNNSTYGLQIHDNNRYLASFKNSGVGNTNYPWIVHDTYNSTGAFIIHFNGFSDTFHFTQNGDGFAVTSFRAPIFYDSNNTAYYADFAGTSVFNQINVTTLNSTSDIRFKSDLQKIDNAVDKLKTISGYTYMLKDHDDRKAGLIAQEVEAVLPEAVKGSENKKLLDYQATIALLVEAVKEQSEEIAILKSRLIKLEN